MRCLVSLIILSFLSLCAGFAFEPSSRRLGVSSSTTLRMTLLSYNGKKVEVKEGTPLSQACVKLGLQPKYSCKKGDCGSCTISVGGARLKPCKDKVPPMPKLKSLQEKGLEVK